MLDVAGNNIANVNTVGFKASTAEFEDTLSQVIKGAGGAQAQAGGTNPAQIGLGVKVAAISTNFTQGSAQATGKATDLMINGDGFFTVQVGGEALYTRNGAFGFDSDGRLVTSDGAFVQGWTAQNGVITDTGAVGNITLTKETVAPAQATTNAIFTGNLPGDEADGAVLTRDVPVYDALGNKSTTQLTFTKSVSAGGWDVSAGGTSLGTLAFTDGELQGSGTITDAASGVT
jgi:flagellar hook protein FlgE